MVIPVVHPCPRQPSLQHLGFPYLGCRGAEQIPVNQNEICPFAGLERADGAFLVLGVSGVKGEGAERFYPRHGLFGMPASEPPAIRVP